MVDTMQIMAIDVPLNVIVLENRASTMTHVSMYSKQMNMSVLLFRRGNKRGFYVLFEGKSKIVKSSRQKLLLPARTAIKKIAKRRNSTLLSRVIYPPSDWDAWNVSLRSLEYTVNASRL